MNGNGGLLQVVGAAVTPVVMISASAILISGISQKHQGLSDRLRGLATEFRQATTPDGRRESIRRQTRIFAQRAAYASAAHVWLYLAVLCFMVMVLILTLAPRGEVPDRSALGVFILGIALMVGSLALELLDLRLAGRTLRIEIEDVLAETSERPGSPPGGETT